MDRAPIPIRQQLHLDFEHAAILGRDAMHAAARQLDLVRHRQCAQHEQRICRRAPKLGLRRRAVCDLGAEHAIPEILEQQKTGVHIGGVDLRRTEARLAERGRHGHEGADILRQARDAAIGQAVADRRTIGLARLIHQDGFPAIQSQARIGASGRVALKVGRAGLGPWTRPA